MATKTEQAIHDLEKVVATLGERLDNSREEMRRDAVRHETLPDSVNDLRERSARVEERVAALEGRFERSDRYRWSLLGLVLGAILSFAANLVLLWVKTAAGE